MEKEGGDVIRELNEAIDLIEGCLLDSDPLMAAEAYLNIPRAHFRAVFYALTGMSPVEYVRRRRLSRASEDMAEGARVTDVAFRYGYDSLDGFTRAYKRWANCTPIETIRTGRMKVMPPISFSISVKGGVSMEYSIKEKPEFSFVGVSARVPMQYEGINNSIVELAQSITPDQREEMHRLNDVVPFGVVNVSWDSDSDFKEEAGNVLHLIGVLTTAKEAGNGLDLLSVPAGYWAVFPCEGPFPEEMQNVTARIYGEWLLSSKWALRDSMMFSYTRYDSGENGFLYSEIWIPVMPLTK